MTVIARELALDIADATFYPDVVAHIPGKMNTTSDALSKRFAPGFEFSLPEELKDACEVFPLERKDTFFRSLQCPRRAASSKSEHKRARNN